MTITKAEGHTPTERYLAKLCDKTFLRLWAYPNPYKATGKEICDVIVVFEDRIFLFFDRETRKFDDKERDVSLQWMRWKQEAIDKQIAQAIGARNHIAKRPDKVFLDAKCSVRIPIPINAKSENIHKIIVAHGAEEACKAASPNNIYGSLAITYRDTTNAGGFPFHVDLPRDDIFHVFDSFNLPILLQERDTIYDFTQYILEKERAIRRYPYFSYCGEEDVLAHYLSNFDKENRRYQIGIKSIDKEFDLFAIGEGEWNDFSRSAPYKRKKEADAASYFWDDLI